MWAMRCENEVVCLCRRFLAGSDSDSEEEDKRVVRSAKDKRFEELSKSCDEMRVRSSALPEHLPLLPLSYVPSPGLLLLSRCKVSNTTHSCR